MNDQLNIRITTERKRKIKSLLALEGLTVSDYLNEKIQEKIDKEAKNSV